jgi:hypothetical protein
LFHSHTSTLSSVYPIFEDPSEKPLKFPTSTLASAAKYKQRILFNDNYNTTINPKQGQEYILQQRFNRLLEAEQERKAENSDYANRGSRSLEARPLRKQTANNFLSEKTWEEVKKRKKDFSDYLEEKEREKEELSLMVDAREEEVEEEEEGIKNENEEEEKQKEDDKRRGDGVVDELDIHKNLTSPSPSPSTTPDVPQEKVILSPSDVDQVQNSLFFPSPDNQDINSSSPPPQSTTASITTESECTKLLNKFYPKVPHVFSSGFLLHKVRNPTEAYLNGELQKYKKEEGMRKRRDESIRANVYAGMYIIWLTVWVVGKIKIEKGMRKVWI